MSIRADGSVYGPDVSYTYIGGFFSAPNDAGVSDCWISRIGTRMSGREPSTYTLREFGNGFTAASSTWAVALRNLTLSFMTALLR